MVSGQKTLTKSEFRSFYDRHVAAILTYSLRRSSGTEQAADVVADTFLVVWRQGKELPPTDEERPWLYGIARRVLANEYRRSRRANRLSSRLREELDRQCIPAWEVDSINNHVVRMALEKLHPQDQELLRLTIWETLKPSEIAIVLDLEVPTVRTRLHRARKRLKQHLEEDGWNDEISETKMTRFSIVGHSEDKRANRPPTK